jgi:arabinofuranosyltransferase
VVTTVDVGAGGGARVQRQQRLLTVTRVLGTLLIVIAAGRLAWISDDALITLRTALNATHGWGSGFNATEAVQGYTHPLWFVVWVGVGAISNQWIFGILVVSLVLVAVAVALVAWRTVTVNRLLAAFAFLLFSNAFMEYATSGLENALAYCTVGALFAMCLVTRGGRLTRGAWPAVLGATSAAVILTRYDLALLILPVLALVAWQWRDNVRALLVALAGLIVPISLWMAWSYATYATVTPNTFAAKTNVDIPRIELIVQGLRYLWVSVVHDPFTLLGLVVGMAIALAIGDRVARAWAFGICVYLAYLVWIGGDFMAGRFLSVPLYVAVFLFATVRFPQSAEQSSVQAEHEERRRNSIVLLCVVVVLLVSSFAGPTPVAIANPQGDRWDFRASSSFGIADERGIYVRFGHGLSGLSDAYRATSAAALAATTDSYPSLQQINESARHWPTAPRRLVRPDKVEVLCGGLGGAGLTLGPTSHLIDSCALTDRFLSALPYAPSSPTEWRVGHFPRPIPAGYVEAVTSADPSLVVDPALRDQLEQLWAQVRRNGTE